MNVGFAVTFARGLFMLQIGDYATWATAPPARTHMIMVTPSRGLNTPGDVTNLGFDEGQNDEIAHLVQQVTRGTYVPMSSGGTSALPSSILPSLTQQIALRYLMQMTQHRVLFTRAPGVSGPMKDFSLTLANHPGARIVLSTDGSMP